MFEFCPKKWFIQYSIQYCLTQDSIQNIIQFKTIFAYLIQGIIQFNSQRIIALIPVEQKKYPKIAQKVSKIDKKGDFSSKMAKIDSKYDSFKHNTLKFNSNDYSISIFSGIFNSKNYSINFFPGKFNSKNLNLALFNSTKYSFN